MYWSLPNNNEWNYEGKLMDKINNNSRKYLLVVSIIAALIVTSYFFQSRNDDIITDNKHPIDIANQNDEAKFQGDKEDVEKSSVANPIDDIPKPKVFPTTGSENKTITLEQMKWIHELMERKKRLISNEFTKGEEWNSEFLKDQYSSWGNKTADEFRERIFENPLWDERPIELVSAECRTRFCKLEFSFREEMPKESRNFFYPDTLDQNNLDLSHALFYNKETQMQNMYVERIINDKTISGDN